VYICRYAVVGGASISTSSIPSTPSVPMDARTVLLGVVFMMVTGFFGRRKLIVECCKGVFHLHFS